MRHTRDEMTTLKILGMILNLSTRNNVSHQLVLLAELTIHQSQPATYRSTIPIPQESRRQNPFDVDMEVHTSTTNAQTSDPLDMKELRGSVEEILRALGREKMQLLATVNTNVPEQTPVVPAQSLPQALLVEPIKHSVDQETNYPLLPSGVPPTLYPSPVIPYSAMLGTKVPPSDPGVPFLPPVPCAPNRPNVWPFDFSPVKVHERGSYRLKHFPNCVCGICREPHPTAIHDLAIHMYEGWRDKTSDATNPCSKCSKKGHTAAGCGFGEFRDWPDNPDMPEAYKAFARSWSRRTVWVPFPQHYYMPSKYPLPSDGYPPLPSFFPDGIPRSLVSQSKGLHWSLQHLVAYYSQKNKPPYDPARHHPWDPWRGFGSCKPAANNPPSATGQTGLRGGPSKETAGQKRRQNSETNPLTSNMNKYSTGAPARKDSHAPTAKYDTYCLHCHTFGHYHDAQCAPTTEPPQEFQTLWSRYFDKGRMRKTNRPETLVDVKDEFHVSMQWPNPTTKAYIEERDDQLNKVDAYLRDQLSQDVYNAWRRFMPQCAGSTRLFLKAFRDIIHEYNTISFCKPIAKLMSDDRISSTDPSKVMFDREEYLHSISNDKNKIRILDFAPVDNTFKRLSTLLRDFLAHQEVLAALLGRLMKANVEARRTQAIRKSFMSPGYFMIIRRGSKEFQL
ncbi:hypothetical protein A1O1_06684 [Capronia coronata CBS 617.96]|uniref:Uncharacterized protein n=1 Tax=Capronia coronata CBS 617.96 TaxID=1182541 RepID=W9Y1F1_9EURO|nr:uncharacterized protein A1O1_06684 [Capronia coronata CBS 617.96]EXJ83066.1 hypothetical protein A1O1_06684 [Capronia coronata CBS 617.96]